LVKAGFQVTVFTRLGSKQTFPASVATKAVDYESVDALVTALQGQDAVVSNLSAVATQAQLNLVAASAKSSVQRFLPSEFGSDTSHPKTAKLPVFHDKIVTQEALKKEAAAGTLTYTLVSNGAFFDWGLAVGLIANAKEGSINLYDGGDRKFSTTTLASVGKAVAGILKHPEETKNRPVYIHDAVITLKQIQEWGEQATGTAWKATVVSIEDELNRAFAELKKEQPDPAKFALNFIRASIWGDGYGSPFLKVDNELLGLKEFSEAEIKAVIEAASR
jgi:uncharacterized protein YbjT (DUF2867 family)